MTNNKMTNSEMSEKPNSQAVRWQTIPVKNSNIWQTVRWLTVWKQIVRYDKQWDENIETETKGVKLRL